VKRGVIFDLDGVLVSTDELHYRAWKELADREGIPFDREVNHRLRGVGRMESLEIILERAPRPYTDDQRRAMAAAKNERYRELLASLTPSDLLPGAAEIVEKLRRRGIRTAVASSSRNAPMILERTGLAGRFDAVVDGGDITRTKPDPEIFLLAARRMGLAPAECVVVEDAPAGIEAARRAGMAYYGIGSPRSLPGVERVAPSLAEVDVVDLVAGA